MIVMIMDYDKLVGRMTDHCSTLDMIHCYTSSSRRPTWAARYSLTLFYIVCTPWHLTCSYRPTYSTALTAHRTWLIGAVNKIPSIFDLAQNCLSSVTSNRTWHAMLSRGMFSTKAEKIIPELFKRWKCSVNRTGNGTRGFISVHHDYAPARAVARTEVKRSFPDGHCLCCSSQSPFGKIACHLLIPFVSPP